MGWEGEEREGEGEERRGERVGAMRREKGEGGAKDLNPKKNKERVTEISDPGSLMGKR